MEKRREVKNVKLIDGFAIFYSRRLPKNSMTTLEDLKQEGHLVLCKCKEGYKKDSNACFQTYFTTALKNQFGKLVNKEHYQKRPAEFSEEIDFSDYRNDDINLSDALDYVYSGNLASETREILDVLIKVPQELVDITSKSVAKYLKIPSYKVNVTKHLLKKKLLEFCII